MPNIYKSKFSNSPFLFILIIILSTSSCKYGRESVSSSGKEKTIATEKIKNKYALLLNTDVNKITNTKLYTFINDWYNVPYQFGGKTKQGIDCSAFVSVLYSEVYNKAVKGTSSSIYNECKAISKNNLMEGDLVFFKIESENISHVGVYLMNNKFVHASTKKGVIINDLDEPYYKKYFFKGGRLNN